MLMQALNDLIAFYKATYREVTNAVVEKLKIDLKRLEPVMRWLKRLGTPLKKSTRFFLLATYRPKVMSYHFFASY